MADKVKTGLFGIVCLVVGMAGFANGSVIVGAPFTVGGVAGIIAMLKG